MLNRRTAFTPAWLLFACVAACGDDSLDDGAGGGGAAPATTTSSGAESTAASPTSGQGTGGNALPDGVLGGYITIDSHEESGGVFAASMQLTTKPGTPGTPCDGSTVGPCEIAFCDDSEGEPGEARFAEVGPITLGGALESATLTVEQAESERYYTTFTSDGVLFSGGENLEVSAPGSPDSSPFQVALIAPSPIEVTSPTYAEGALTLGGDDVRVAWNGGGAGDVWIEFRTTRFDDSASIVEYVSVACRFDATAGEGTVPAAALADLFPTGDLVVGISGVTAYTDTSANVDAGSVRVIATNDVTSSTSVDGRPVGYLNVE